MALRRALLVGINDYPGAPLRGCINDVKQMQDMLKRYFGFQDDGIKLVLDKTATADGIKAGLEWLAQGGNDTDAVRVFHFSGHGTQVADQNGDEPDGSDECLVPYDYQQVGMITDDVLKTYYDRFPASGNLSLVMDSCHSGSVNRVIETDIAYRFIPVSWEEQQRIDTAAAKFAENQQEFVVSQLVKLRDQALPDDELRAKVASLMATFQKKRFGDVRTREANVLLAGCRSDQQCADANIANDYHGAFTLRPGRGAH